MTSPNTRVTVSPHSGCCPHCRDGCARTHRLPCDECTRPDLCWSRHFDNIGKPRPQAVWTIVYGCLNGHTITANVCDRCASSLVDGHQRCARCLAPMVVMTLDGLRVEAIFDAG